MQRCCFSSLTVVSSNHGNACWHLTCEEVAEQIQYFPMLDAHCHVIDCFARCYANNTEENHLCDFLCLSKILLCHHWGWYGERIGQSLLYNNQTQTLFKCLYSPHLNVVNDNKKSKLSVFFQAGTGAPSQRVKLGKLSWQSLRARSWCGIALTPSTCWPCRWRPAVDPQAYG